MNNFIVFEGVCCSGKTILCNTLSNKISTMVYLPI